MAVKLVRAAAEPSFATLQKAIGAGRENERGSKEIRDKVKDATILDVYSTSTGAAFKLSNNLYLAIDAQPDRAFCTLTDGLPSRFEQDAALDEYWVESSTGQPYLWPRKNLIMQRRGRQITNVFLAKVWVYLYVKGGPILVFWPVYREPDHELTLYWSETD